MAHTALFRLLRRTVHMAHRQSQAEGVQPSSFKACLSRCKFIKTASLAGGTAIATIPLSPLQQAVGYSSSTPKIAIIAGGIAGLNAAYRLNKSWSNGYRL
jgi:hypothetical protein